MNFELLVSKAVEFFGIKKGTKNYLKKANKNKEKVSNYVKKQCESKLVTKKAIVDVINQINEVNKNENKKVHFTEFSNEEIEKRKTIHNKAKDAIATETARYYLADEIINQSNLQLPRSMQTIIRNMASSPEEEINICNNIFNFQNTNDEKVKASSREKIKAFFTKSINKCKETIDSFTSISNDDDKIIDFYKKNIRVLNTTSELQSTNNGTNHYLKKIEEEFGFTFDNNLAEEYGKNYSSFGVEATMICSKVHAMANPLYPEIDVNEAAPALRILVDPPSQITFSSLLGRKATELTLDDLNKKEKDLLNPLNSYGKVSENLSPIQLAEFQFGKDIPDEIKYERQADRFKNHLSFVLNSRGYDGGFDNFDYYDKKGFLVQNEDALKRMLNGESLIVTQRLSSNFIMEASSDPKNSFGFLNRNNKYDISKIDKKDDLINENDSLLKELETLKKKKDSAWFNFTRKKYQKQIDETQSKIEKFNDNYSKNFDANIYKGVRQMVYDVNNYVLLIDKDKDLYMDFIKQVTNLANVNPSQTEQFKEQLKLVDKAATKYITEKIESGRFEVNASFQQRFNLVSNIKEACYNYSNLCNEFDSSLKENVDKINEVSPGLGNKKVEAEPEIMYLDELDDEVFVTADERIKNMDEKIKEYVKE